ncbi:hypothetical protein MASR2M41_15700 [Flammeovirgaceae bacterium]
MMVVIAILLKTAPYLLRFRSRLNVKMILEICWTIAPTMKEMNTDKNIPEMMVIALE